MNIFNNSTAKPRYNRYDMCMFVRRKGMNNVSPFLLRQAHPREMILPHVHVLERDMYNRARLVVRSVSPSKLFRRCDRRRRRVAVVPRNSQIRLLSFLQWEERQFTSRETQRKITSACETHQSTYSYLSYGFIISSLSHFSVSTLCSGKVPSRRWRRRNCIRGPLAEGTCIVATGTGNGSVRRGTLHALDMD